jgi:hypothetical protein
MPLDAPITLDDLRAMASGDIDQDEPRYREPLVRDAFELSQNLGRHGQVVLLGSIATGKYVDVLLEALPDRLGFPKEFIGRGDMSRGGLLLRCAREGRELTYVQVAGAVRRGVRPPKLPRRV